MSDRRIILIGVAIVVVLSAAGAWAHLGAAAERQHRIASLRQEAQVFQTSGQDDRMEAHVALLRSRFEEQRKALPENDDIAVVLQILAQDLDELDVTDRSLNCGEADRLGPVRHFQLNLSFKGSLATAFELLNRLNASERVLRVERLVISRDQQSGPDALAITLRIATFSSANPEAQP